MVIRIKSPEPRIEVGLVLRPRCKICYALRGLFDVEVE